MTHILWSRRALIGGAAAVAAFPSPAISQGRKLRPTPEQSEGPFYPVEIPEDSDADLLRFSERAAPEGIPALVSGRVLDAFGRPIQGARVEIWQCDAHGRYNHPDDDGRRRPDPNFQGYGRVIVDAEGRYQFRTIRPVPYGGRAPHIHYIVSARGRRSLTTQLYVEGEPRNANDGLLQSVRNREARASIIRPFAPAPEIGLGPNGTAASFDVVLD